MSYFAEEIKVYRAASSAHARADADYVCSARTTTLAQEIAKALNQAEALRNTTKEQLRAALDEGGAPEVKTLMELRFRCLDRAMQGLDGDDTAESIVEAARVLEKYVTGGMSTSSTRASHESR